MPEITDQFVDYFIYCKTCKYRELDGWKDPCNDCMNTPVRKNSTKPINYIKQEENS